MNIRNPSRSDLPELELVVAETQLFPPEMLDELITPFFDQSDHQEKWLVSESSRGQIIGFAYFRPEPLTEGTWNLLAIGFLNDQRGRGFGAELVSAVENALKGQRVLIVETSSLDDYELTRRFYEKCGYEQEAVIRDYWSDGDDKVIYRKALT